MAGSEFRGGPRGDWSHFVFLSFALQTLHTHGGSEFVFLSLFPKVMGSTGTSTPAVGPSSPRFLTLRSIFLVYTAPWLAQGFFIRKRRIDLDSFRRRRRWALQLELSIAGQGQYASRLA
jgi:hypothetical protein